MIQESIILVVIVIFVALLFEYINGFHDSANAIATVVSTKVLSPKYAVIYAGALNFFGAFVGTHVAKTIGSGMVDKEIIDQPVIICALAGAIIWNLITWYYAIPSSSSHALIGGLVGAAVAKAGVNVIHIQGLNNKVLIPMITSPFVGLLFGFLIMLLLLWLFFRSNPGRVNKYFKKLQLLSSGIMAFSHGSNDAQKTMGIITLSLYSFGAINTFNVPVWVILICALVMALGTMAGGWRIIRTMGSKVIKLRPIHGFAAETSAASIILTASHFGIPLSTTHVISCSIMGVGCTQNPSAVKWGVVGNIIKAWVLTIPICIVLSGFIYYLLQIVF